MRRSATWMLLPDDRILEYLDEHGAGVPEYMAREIPASVRRIRARCQVLVDAGLIAPKNPRGRVYELTRWGRAYLDERIAEFHDRRPTDAIEVHEADVLRDPPGGAFDWVLCNPPFTRYNRLGPDDRAEYTARFDLATGKFPLYVPFFEQALRVLEPGGCLTFILS